MATKKYFKLIADNRKAKFDYTILEKYKAGLSLTGNEVKSIRLGRVNLKESFARVEKDELWLHGMHINPYQTADKTKLDPVRQRKLLLQKRELVKLKSKAAEKGLTIVPLRLFFEGNWAKLEIGLGKAKRKFEKRERTKRREAQREIERATARKNYAN